MERGGAKLEGEIPSHGNNAPPSPFEIVPHQISRNEETIEQAFLEIDLLRIKYSELEMLNARLQTQINSLKRSFNMFRRDRVNGN